MTQDEASEIISKLYWHAKMYADNQFDMLADHNIGIKIDNQWAMYKDLVDEVVDLTVELFDLPLIRNADNPGLRPHIKPKEKL